MDELKKRQRALGLQFCDWLEVRVLAACCSRLRTLCGWGRGWRLAKGRTDSSTSLLLLQHCLMWALKAGLQSSVNRTATHSMSTATHTVHAS